MGGLNKEANQKLVGYEGQLLQGQNQFGQTLNLPYWESLRGSHILEETQETP